MAHRSWRIVHSEASLGWGGQEHRVMAELTGFQRRGSEVWLIAPAESEIFRRAEIEKIPTIPLRTGKLHFHFEVIRLARWLRQNQIQILNTHSSRDGWLLGIAGRFARVPLIIRTRHIDVDYPNRWLSRHAYTTLADHVLTTSRKITAHFQKMFDLPDERISTVPTGVDLKLFSPDGLKADLIPSGEKLATPLIGMVSVLRSWKGHATFLQAARILLDENFAARFVIVGEGPIRHKIESQIQQLKLSDKITLVGHREDVSAVLRALDVLVIASTRHEGVPQIGLQALSTKTPVVGSDVGGIPEIIRHGETGRIFPAENADALAKAIRATLADTESSRAMTERGRTLVETYHSLDQMIETIEALYNRHLPA